MTFQTDAAASRKHARQMVGRIASRYPTRYLRGYARGKLRSDPVYAAAWQYLQGNDQPVLDLGCGIGLFEQYLREYGHTAPVIGIDPDASKINAARHATQTLRDVSFIVGSATDPIAVQGHVVIFDVLHYLTPADQNALLQRLARQVAPGGYCLIRATPRDRSWRYFCTRMEERFVRAIGWMAAPAVAFQTRQAIVEPFEKGNFRVQIMPAWGATPFNSYLFVFHRPTDAG